MAEQGPNRVPSAPAEPNDRLRDFYDGTGWNESSEGHTQDALLFEDLRPAARSYLSACRRRLLPFLARGGKKILDAASGPIQYPEYLEYSAPFACRVCVDISQRALDGAKAKLGEKGEYHLATLERLPFSDSEMDAAISLHTVYHIDKDLQAQAVRELIRVTKVGAPIVVVYSNPFPWYARVIHFFEKLFWERPRLLRAFRRLVGRDVEKIREANSHDVRPIYFFPHPLEWWTQFQDQCELRIVSWRFLTAEHSRKWIPDNVVGRIFLSFVSGFEKLCPRWAADWCAYPMIILRKRH